MTDHAFAATSGIMMAYTALHIQNSASSQERSLLLRLAQGVILSFSLCCVGCSVIGFVGMKSSQPPSGSVRPPAVDSPIGKVSAPIAVERSEYWHPAMGTRFKIVVLTPVGKSAEASVESAFARIDEIEKVASDWDRNSEVRVLCRSVPHIEPMKMSDDLRRILSLSQIIYERSSGRFDITLGGWTRLWRRCHKAGRIPSPEELAKASVGQGMHHLQLSDQGIYCTASQLALDLGGIAKGFAVDEALKVMIDQGYPHSLVDGGGDIAFGPPAPSSKGWIIESPSGVFQFDQSGAVATSGDSARYIEVDGVRYSHILDPRTGFGLQSSRTITVYSRSCAEADAMATALSIPSQVVPDPLLQQLQPYESVHIIPHGTNVIERFGEFKGVEVQVEPVLEAPN